MRKDPRVYLAQILECIGRIETYTQEGKAVFLNERMIQDAVIRNFQIMGEAAKRISDEYRLSHPEIPWRSLAAFRDVLVHDYEGIDSLEVWRVVEAEIAPLKKSIRAVVPSLEKLESELAGEADDGEVR